MFDTVVAIELETTGPDPYRHEILELAGAIYADGEISARFSELVRPAGPVPVAVRKAAGLRAATRGTSSDTRDPGAVIADFLDFLPEGATCISHHARRVRGFLRRATRDQFRRPVLDTEELARIGLPDLPEHTLEGLRDRLGLPGPGRPGPAEGRRALADCEATLYLLRSLAERALAIPRPVLAAINRLFANFRRSPLREFFRAVAEHVPGSAPTASATAADPGAILVSLFREEALPRPRRSLPDPLECKMLDADGVAELLGPDGPFAGRIDGYEYRHEQVVMARAVTESLNGSQHLLVEAGTGIGKSLAYLVPAVLWATTNDTPVVVSTNTKNLQAQLFEKDLPLVREVLGRECRTALIKGRRNYLCLRKLLYLLRSAVSELDRAERIDLAGVLVWAASTRTGDLSESIIAGRTARAPGGAEPVEWRRPLAGRISSMAEECPGRECPHSRRCFVYRARRTARAADVIVANHSIVFAEMTMPESSPVLPPYAHIVFDEAQNLENAATSHFSVEVSAPRIQRLLRRLWRPARRRTGAGLIPALLRRMGSGSSALGPELGELASRHGSETGEAVAAAAARVQPFFDALETLLSVGGGAERSASRADRAGAGRADVQRIYADRKRASLWEPIRVAKEQLVAGLAGVMRPAEALAGTLDQVPDAAFADRVDFCQELSAVVHWLRELIRDIELVLAADDPGYVYWVQRTDPRRDRRGARTALGRSRGASVEAWAAPVNVGPMLLEHVYRPKQAAVFTSATLTVRGSTQFVRRRLGLDLVEPERVAELNAGTPFDYPRQCLVMVPLFLPEPGDADRDYAAELAVLLAEVFRRTGGRAMALFTSYDMLERTTGVLRDELLGDDVRVLAQGSSGSRENITRLFKRDLRSVLMGTHSFWEGVDLVGETLSCLAVARLPFAVYTDPIHQARCEQIEAAGGSAFFGYSVPTAVIRFRQGFGRLIRHRTDRGIVIVADRRVVTRRYGEWFRRSLPVRTFTYPDRDEFLAEVETFFERPSAAADGPEPAPGRG